MNFAERLLKLRKSKDLTQQALADQAGLHVVQVRRYETQASQPSLEAIRKTSRCAQCERGCAVVRRGRTRSQR